MSLISKLWNQDSSDGHSIFTSPRSISLGSSGRASTAIAKASNTIKSSTSSSTSTRNSKAQGDSVHSLLTLNRYESDIQRRFQTLLDVQAERLLAVTGDHNIDAQSASDVASSSGASVRVSEHPRVKPVRQPAPQRLSLRATRKEIGTALRELSTIKDQEKLIYAAEMRQKEETAARITAWQNRQDGLNNEVQSIQTSEQQARLQELQDENSTLQEQINALENQLMELRGQQNAVKLQLSQLENSTQSKLSSYTESLRILEIEVQEFLAQPLSTFPGLHAEQSAYQSLPPSRRTLKLASDHTQEDVTALRELFRISKEESEATQEGQIVWRDVVSAVTDLEQHMRQHMRKMLSARDPDTQNVSNEISQATLGSLLEDIDRVTIDLDSKLRLSEARGWKLLVCCIGAELDALHKGRAILADDIANVNPGKGSASDPDPTSVAINNRSATGTPPFTLSSAGSDTTSPSRRPSESAPLRASWEVKDIKQEGKTASPASPAHRPESGDDSSTRRSLDSFRRRNDRNPTRLYRPEDDEPALDLLITEPDYHDP